MKQNRLGAILGIAFVVFLVVSFATGNTPQANASGAKVIHYYTVHRNEAIVSVCADLLGMVAALFFFAYLHTWLRRTDPGWLPTVQIIAAAVFIVTGSLEGGTILMLVDQGRHISPDVAKGLNLVSEDIIVVLAAASVGALALATGLSVLARGSASKWFAITAVVIGVVAIVGFITPLGLFGIGLWILAFSIRLLVRPDEHRVATMAGSDAVV